MGKRIDVEPGSKYWRFTIIKEVEPHVTSGGNRKRMVRCICKCGSTKDVLLIDLINGRIKSCGCFSKDSARERAYQRNTTHNMYHTPEYDVWMSMKKRCNNKRHKSYNDYGGRGIKICEEWNRSFLSFLKDMGQRPSKEYSIYRINNDDGYYKENCRWATKKEQCQNQRTNINITYKGETKCLSEWARSRHMSYQKLWHRLRVAKYELEKAFNNE